MNLTRSHDFKTTAFCAKGYWAHSLKPVYKCLCLCLCLSVFILLLQFLASFDSIALFFPVQRRLRDLMKHFLLFLSRGVRVGGSPSAICTEIRYV